MREGNYQPAGFTQITDLSSVVGVGTIPAGARYALIQALDQNVRWRDDGSNPSSNVGMQLTAGNDFWYQGDLSTIKFIEDTSGAELNISFYRDMDYKSGA